MRAVLPDTTVGHFAQDGNTVTVLEFHQTNGRAREGHHAHCQHLHVPLQEGVCGGWVGGAEGKPKYHLLSLRHFWKLLRRTWRPPPCDRRPAVEEVFARRRVHRSHELARDDLDPPGRWMDRESRLLVPSWISIAWRGEDDHLHAERRDGGRSRRAARRLKGEAVGGREGSATGGITG